MRGQGPATLPLIWLTNWAASWSHGRAGGSTAVSGRGSGLDCSRDVDLDVVFPWCVTNVACWAPRRRGGRGGEGRRTGELTIGKERLVASGETSLDDIATILMDDLWVEDGASKLRVARGTDDLDGVVV